MKGIVKFVSDNFLKIVVATLLACNVLTLYYTDRFKRNLINTIYNNPYPLLDFSRNFKPQSDYIVNLKSLREQLANIIGTNTDFQISMYLEYLNTGSNISLNPEHRFFPASLTKVPIAMIYMKKVEEGKLSLETEFKILEGDKDSEWGELYKKPANSQIPLEELIMNSLVYSDNTAHNVLYRNLDQQDVEIFGEELGLQELFDESGKITAKEYARIFRSLYTSSYLKRESSQNLLAWLSQTPFNNFLGSGLPEGVVFSHKIGEKKLEGLYLDSGIIYIPNRPVLVTIIIDKVPEQDNAISAEISKENAIQVMKKVSKLIYEYLQK